MKNLLLSCLAAAALTLSFCFEPDSDASVPASAPAPAAAEASLLSGLTGGKPVVTLATLPALPAAAANAASPEAPAVKPAQPENKTLLHTVSSWLGTPYSYGANSKRGTDCSGFVTRVFKAVYGVSLKRSSRSMFGTVKRVAKGDLKAGDLVFFSHSRRSGGIYHVGIYLKDGKFAHSACNGGVMISSLHQDYYSRNFYAAGRVAGTNVDPGAETLAVDAEALAAAISARPQ